MNAIVMNEIAAVTSVLMFVRLMLLGFVRPDRSKPLRN